MNWRDLLIALAFAGVSSCDRPEPKLRPPNVVVIVIDTLRADHVDPDGIRARTPNMLALAQDAVDFPNAFSHTPITLPSHTSLFSARMPYETGVRTNGQAVSRDLPLLADWLDEHGFQSQAVVSLSSMWPPSGGRGLDRGFERFERGPWNVTRGEEINHSLVSALDELALEPPFFLFAHYSDPHEPYDAHGTVERYTELFFDGRPFGTVCTSDMSQVRRTVLLSPGEHVLEIRGGHPFKIRSFECETPDAEILTKLEIGELHKRLGGAKLSIRNPGPQTVTATLSLWLHDALAEEEIPGRYRAEVEHTDRCVGALLTELKRRGLYDSSVIVLTSDHGEGLGEHGTFGHVVHLYDELLRVPLMIKLPSGNPGIPALERAREKLVRLIDVAPTVLDAIGLPPLPDQTGASLLRPDEAPRVLIAQTQRAEPGNRIYCARDGKYKLIYYANDKRFEMFDLERDPGEIGDVFAERGGERGEWQDTLKALAAQNLRDGEREVDPAARARLEALGY